MEIVQTALMKSELKAKFLQYLSQKNQNSGFTLIELLVVIIIIGILAAVALPSYLSQTAKARAADARTNVGSMNRAQQAYYLEQQIFTTDFNALGLSWPNSGNNFDYSARVPPAGLTQAVTNLGTSRLTDVKSYAGGVFYSSGSLLLTIVCEADNPGTTAVADPVNSNQCGANSQETGN